MLFKYIQQHTLQVLQRTAIGPSPHNAGPVKEVEALIVFVVVSGIYVWKLNQTMLELDFRAVKFLFFPRRDLNPHHWYTAAPFA